MNTLPAFPKIHAVGYRYIRSIFDDPVEITEKVDGSQIGFGRFGDELCIRSKGTMMVPEAPDQMFKLGVEHILRIKDKLIDGAAYVGEYLRKPKHNVLAYNSIPLNHIALFAVRLPGDEWLGWDDIADCAHQIEVDVVPLLSKGKIEGVAEMMALLDRESYLGGPKIEGVVVKNYKPYMIGDLVIPIMSGKLVSEKYKEKHEHDWKVQNTGKGRWGTFVEQFRNENRWRKAVQHLREAGSWDGTPRDIGILIKEIQGDIVAEEKDHILEVLWKEFGTEVLRKAIAGFPEWYKEQLALGTFDLEGE